MNEREASTEQLRVLEEENAELRRQLKEKQGIDEDLYSYRIFLEARKKLFAWIGGAAVLLTAFGIYSLQDIVKKVREKVDDKVLEQIVTGVEADLKLQSERQVTKLAVGQVDVLLARLEEKLEDDFRAARPIVAANPADTIPVVAEEYRPVDAGELYYVVAGSSPVIKDLERELANVKRKVGSEFDGLFPNVQIQPPLGGNTNYALVIDGNLTRAAASELKRQAIEEGFRDDTFLWKAKKVNFKTTSD